MPDITDATASANTDAPATGSEEPVAAATQTPDELATLKSRNTGLNKANTELQQALAAEKAARAAAEKAADDLRTGKTSEQEALAKLLADAKAEVEATKTEAALARIEAKYPETFKLFGAATATMQADVLAASEARLTGAPDEGEESDRPTPKPVGNNPPRTATGNKRIEDMTKDELNAEWAKLTPADMGLTTS